MQSHAVARAVLVPSGKEMNMDGGVEKRQYPAVLKRLIHCAVAITSLALAISQAPARPTDAETQTHRAAADALFTNNLILKLEIEVSDAGLDSLDAEPRQYVSVTIREGDTVYTNAVAHLKGSIGSYRKLEEKPGWTIRLKDTSASLRFHGLRKFHLNNCVQDPTYLSEWVCTDLFRAANVPANRVAHALVQLNGRKVGLYALLETMDRDFLGRYFNNTEGNLYGQSSFADITVPLERMEGKGENTRADLTALATAARENDPVKLRGRLDPVLDLDRFLSYMAMEVMLCHWDGYTFAAHNYRVYGDPDSGKMVFLPHDLDQMLVDPSVPIHPAARGIVARDILNVPEARAAYRQRFETLFTNVFIVPAVSRRIDDWIAKTTPALEAYDPDFAREMRAKANTMKERVQRRAQMLEQFIQMPEPANQVLQVNVLDAATQLLIPQFTITPGYREGDNGFVWDRTQIYRALRGSFYLDMFEARLPRLPNFLRFDAPGYLPVVAAYNLSTNAEDANFRIELKKAERLTGNLAFADGTPARRAQVALLTESSTPLLARARLLSEPGMPVITSGDRARFSFSPDPEATRVVAVHEKGFAESSVDDLPPAAALVLQPWGRIAGKWAGDATAMTQCVAVVTPLLALPEGMAGFHRGTLSFDPESSQTNIPVNGSFGLENIPPGERFLWRSVAIPHSADPTHPTPGYAGRRVMVKPGETYSVVWRENEGALRGQAVPNPDVNPPQTKSENNAPVPLESDGKMGIMKLTRKEKQTELPEEFFFTVAPDGSFFLPGLAPGDYRAELRVYQPPRWLGWAENSITVPPHSGPSAGAPFDWGKIVLQPVPSRSVGDIAPAFEVKSVDGSSLRLADYRGKYVMLHFWASWCGGPVMVLSALRSVADAFQSDGRLVMIGLNLDSNPQTAQRYVQRHSLAWRQGCLGEWFLNSLPSEYGARSLPAIMLVGPDGKIVGQNLNPAKLLVTLRTHLD